jgi:transcriptional regulator with XRE-family HTH domain
MSRFHLRLRELRKVHGLSQQELADRLKISKSSINMYERGEREPGIDTLENIADFFNVDLSYLTGKSDNPQSANIWSEFDEKFDTEKLSLESKLRNEIKNVYGADTVDAVNLFTQLDDTDKGKVIGRMETMLEDDKYQKGLEEKVI